MGLAPICLKISARIAKWETYRMITLSARLFSHWSIPLTTIYIILYLWYLHYSFKKMANADYSQSQMVSHIILADLHCCNSFYVFSLTEHTFNIFIFISLDLLVASAGRGPHLGCQAEIRTRACLTANRRKLFMHLWFIRPGVLMRADRLRGEVGGSLAVGIESFLGPFEMVRANRPAPFGYSSITQFIRNQQQSLRCIKGGSGS